MNKVMKHGLIPVVLFLGTGAAQAITPGLYLGGGAGIAAFKTPTGYSADRDTGFGGRLFLGYNFNQYFGIESNYASLGKKTFVNNYFPLSSGQYSLNALSLVGKVYLPLAYDSPLNVYGLVGASQMYGKFDSDRTWFKSSYTHNAFVPTAGLGVSYEISQRFTVGLELSGYGKKKTEYSYGIPRSALGTLSLGYRF